MQELDHSRQWGCHLVTNSCCYLHVFGSCFLVAPPLHSLHTETEVIVCLFFFFLPVFMPHPSSAELTLLAFAAGAFAAALSAPSDPAFVLLRRARLPG